jgi:hypothetical protein
MGSARGATTILTASIEVALPMSLAENQER